MGRYGSWFCATWIARCLRWTPIPVAWWGSGVVLWGQPAARHNDRVREQATDLLMQVPVYVAQFKGVQGEHKRWRVAVGQCIARPRGGLEGGSELFVSSWCDDSGHARAS